MKVSRDEFLKNLETIREQQGEEAYLRARQNFAVMFVLSPGGEEWLRMTFPDLDLEVVKAEASKRTPPLSNEQMIGFLRTQVPNLKSQVEFDTFMAAFNALTLAMNSYFGGKLEDGDTARKALDQALTTARKIPEIASRVEELPEESRSKTASEFVTPPKAFTEVEDQRRLLAELEAIKTATELKTWYQANRGRLDGVVTTRYRNELFDAIRDKQSALAN